MSDENNEMAEIHRRFNGALIGSLTGATQLASVVLEFYAARLRRAALAGQEQARAERALVAARHRADRQVWSQARRADWWRTASAEDIAQAWRTVNTWADVDPRAREAREQMREELRRRGVQVDDAVDRPGDATWVRTALDLAGAEARVEEPVDDPAELDRLVHTEADRLRMAEHVRAAWPADRADLVVDRDAWGALAYTMHRLEHEGHDVQAMLRGLPDVSRARTPAALTVWMLEHAATEARVDEQAQADAQRTVERDERTIEGDWVEDGQKAPPATAARAAAEERADLAHGQAETAADRAAAHEDSATGLAATVATGYPTSTDAAVAQAGADRRAGTGYAAALVRAGYTAVPGRPATKGAAGPPRARPSGEQER